MLPFCHHVDNPLRRRYVAVHCFFSPTTCASIATVQGLHRAAACSIQFGRLVLSHLSFVTVSGTYETKVGNEAAKYLSYTGTFYLAS